MMAAAIRRAELKDLPEILRLISASRLSPWSLEDLKRELSDSQAFMLVAVADSATVTGFLHARAVPSNRREGGYELEICNIGVDMGFRRQGIGRSLLSDLLRRSSSFSPVAVRLEVRTSNSTAIKFYEAEEFHRCGIRRKFYREPEEDAVLMSLDLKADK